MDTPETKNTDPKATADDARHIGAPAHPAFPRWHKPLKIAAWICLGIAVFVYGLLAGILTILSPEKLTPLVCSIAGNNLNAEVRIDRVELSLTPGLDMLRLDMSNTSVLSRDILKMDPETRDGYGLPQYADTVMTMRSLSGGLKLTALLADRIELHDVTIDSPRINLVVVEDTTTNFNIFKPSQDTTATDIAALPELALNRFKVINPQPLRYYDCETGSQFTANFRAIDFIGKDAPLYTLDFSGNVEAPLLMEYFHFDDLGFALQGNLRWSQKKPYNLALDNFRFKVSLLEGTVSTDIDFTNRLVINKLDLKLRPINIYKAIHLLPDELAEGLAEDFGVPLSLYTDLRTDLSIQLDGRLLKPFNAATDGLPCMELAVTIPESKLQWGDIDLQSLKASIVLNIPSPDLDAATLRVNYLDMSGPATDIHIKGTFTKLLSDPQFDADVSTRTQIAKLPPVLRKLFGGEVKGELTAQTHIRGSASMLTPDGFQHLLVNGDVGLRNFSWVANDTVNMLSVDRALFKFGSQERFRNEQSTMSAPMLSANLQVDSATMLTGNYLMGLKGLRTGIAVQNSRKTERLGIQPMGGGLKFDSFNFLSISDTAVVRLRKVDGKVIIRPIDGNLHRPEFIFDLGMGRLSAGDNTTRLMVSKAQLNFSARRHPETERQKAIRASAEKILRRQPDISPDSAIAIAEAIHRRPSHKKYPRVHPEMTDSLSEVIDFGTSKFLRRLLTRWDLHGTLISNRARMFTPYFPLRNRLRNIDISFNNDSLILNNIQYKAGRSDITFSGEITDMRRALTSRRQRVPLKIRFRSISDTIDVNQLANTAFTGAAYAQSFARDIRLDSEDEDRLDSIIGAHVADAPQAMAPLLIPRNIDLELKCNARNVLYSDLLMHNMTGSMLAYDGALNLNRLKAYTDIGDIGLSALYMGANADSLSFGFGLQIDRFKLHKFLDMVPAIDSIAPTLRNFSGIISADIACTTPIDRHMDFRLDQLDAAIKLSGQDLVLLDPETFKSISKWLLFKNKKRNIIDSMSVQMSIDKGVLNIYPFIFNIDRYRLGVLGHNDFNLNFDYHIAVLKSPIPFRFGINIKGTPEKYKVRLGGAKFNEKTPLKQEAFVDNTRINLMRQIENVFRRGVRGANMRSLQLDRAPEAAGINLQEDALTAADSLELYRQGMIPEPPASLAQPAPDNNKATKNKKGKKDKKSTKKTSSKDQAYIPRKR